MPGISTSPTSATAGCKSSRSRTNRPRVLFKSGPGEWSAGGAEGRYPRRQSVSKHLPFLWILLLLTAAAASAGPPESPDRVRVHFDAGWRFRRDPAPRPGAAGAFRWTWRPAEVNTLDVPMLPASLEQ